MARDRLTTSETYALQELARADGFFTGRPVEMVSLGAKGIVEACISTRDRSQKAWRLTPKGRAVLASLSK